MPDITHTSGGVNFTGDASVNGDVVGRDKIIQAAPDPLAQYLHQLPPAPSDFVGRADEQRDLLNLVEGGAVITGLRGLGGIGKTALGLMVAHQLKARFPDAQFFLDLRGAGANPVSPLEALTHVVRAYHPTAKLPDTLEAMQALYRSVLDGQRALVFFDNARDAQHILPLLPPASCLLLITSRAHFALPGLKAKDLNVLPPDAARELVLGIAAHIGACADDITKLCGYLPQALRASASLLADEIDRDPCDYVTQLRDERQRLHTIGLDPARNLDMEASLNLSYAALTAEEQRTLARLSVFPADFDAAAEEAICEDAGHVYLSRLVKLSLVQYMTPTPSPSPVGNSPDSGGEIAPSPVRSLSRTGEGRGGGRYSLHDLVRLFAASHLPDADRAAAQYQHAKYYEQVSRQTNTLYLQGNDFITQGLALFDREWTNIQAGHTWSKDNAKHDTRALELCDEYPAYCYNILPLRQHPQQRVEWLVIALDAARLLNRKQAQCWHLGNLGIAYDNLGETRKAIEFYEQQLVIVREIGDRRGEGQALGNLGVAYMSSSDETRKAIEFYEQSLVVKHEIGDRRGEGETLGNLGVAYKNLGETRKAIEFYEQCLVIARDIGNRRGEGNALGNLGVAYKKNLSETRKAIEFYEQSLVVKREIGDRRGEGNSLWNMALALDELGEREQAIAHAEAALKIREAIEDPNAEKVRKQLAAWKGL